MPRQSLLPIGRLFDRFRPAWLAERTAARDKARQLYGSIVAYARTETFYREFGVPDTTMGRLELIILHLVLLIARLQREGERGERVAQLLAEAFVADMDDSIREIGIGDLGVPRRVKQAAGALYERHRAMGKALAEGGPEALTRLVGAAVWGEEGRAEAPRLAQSLKRTWAELERLPAEDLFAGRLELPAPKL